MFDLRLVRAYIIERLRPHAHWRRTRIEYILDCCVLWHMLGIAYTVMRRRLQRRRGILILIAVMCVCVCCRVMLQVVLFTCPPLIYVRQRDLVSSLIWHINHMLNGEWESNCLPTSCSTREKREKPNAEEMAEINPEKMLLLSTRVYVCIVCVCVYVDQGLGLKRNTIESINYFERVNCHCMWSAMCACRM